MFFTRSTTPETYALVYEIGSGSVLLSIIKSAPKDATPTIIWSHREYITANHTPDLNRTAKKLGAALMNVGMLCNSAGMQALMAHNPHARITRSYATLAAPWSYTINKVVEYTNERKQPVTIDRDLIQELAATATANTETELAKQEHLANGLQIINHRIVSIAANGYEITSVLGKTAQHVTMSHISALALTHMTQIVTEVHAKILPKVPLEQHSFMMTFFYVLHATVPTRGDYCLLDITHEAAELGVIRDKKLTYCSYLTGGANTLAQTISQMTELPYESVMIYLKEPDEKARSAHIPEKKQAIVDKVLAQYRADIYDLFHETEDILIAPRIVYLHCDPLLEAFYIDQLQQAICKPQQSTCEVKAVNDIMVRRLRTPDVTGAPNQNDTALDIAAYFFHTDGDKYGDLED